MLKYLTMDAKATAEKFVTAIWANVDAYYHGEQSYDNFSFNQRLLWDAINEAEPEVREFVTAAIRKEMPINGPRKRSF